MKQFGVIGLGRFGKSVATTLSELGHEVVVIDINEYNINELSEYITHGLIGDSTQKSVLKAAGIQEVDVAIVAITNFETSIMTSLLCKEIGTKKVIAKARNDIHAMILEKIGVDDIVVPEKDMGRKLAYNISNKNVIESISLSSNFEIVEIRVPKAWQGSTIAQLDIRKKFGLNILGVNRGHNEFIGNPSPSIDLKPNDTLLILGGTSQLAELQDIE